MVESVMEKVDINESNKIDFSEFLMASLSKDLISEKTRIEQAFDMFDQNGQGVLTREDLENVMGPISQKYWEEILEDCDTN